jgi:hypothetical protein
MFAWIKPLADEVIEPLQLTLALVVELTTDEETSI